jgi:hypothetical protein
MPPTAPIKEKATKRRVVRLAGLAIIIIIGIIILSAIFPAFYALFAPALFAPSATDHLNQGVALYEAGKYEQAVAEYTKAIELDPNLASAYYNRGLAYFKMKQYDLALADFNKATELNPNASAAWTGRGTALQGLGKYKEALEAYNKALEINPNDQSAKDNRDRLLAYIASLPITYNRGQFGLKTTTTEIQGDFKIVRTATCTTYGYPFDLKLYRAVLSGQTIYVGTAETTLHYEGDWSVAVTQTREGEKVDVITPSGHVSGNVKAVILGIWQAGTVKINGTVGPLLGLMIGPAELPPEGLTILVKVKYSRYDQEGKLIYTDTIDYPLMHPIWDIQMSFLDASYDSSPYVTGGKVPSIPTNIEEISKMDLDEFISLSGYKWTKIRFTGATTLETYFSGASAFLNPPMNPNSKSEYINGYAQFESNFIPGLWL